ncbi:MAG: STAS/SEC14 domain-containing protein [Gammaproteobacteria bacterium]|nr:STAS/SEC14 domain-containing protein [Gammaproteobacteria bacterium]
MLIVNLDEANSVVSIEPTGSLDVKDFQAAASTIDPFIEKCGQLKGLIIHTESFPGWDSFSALITHLKFVKNHHAQIKRIAFVTDSVVGSLAESLVSHFIDAQIKHFPYAKFDQAKQWVIS